MHRIHCLLFSMKQKKNAGKLNKKKSDSFECHCVKYVERIFARHMFSDKKRTLEGIRTGINGDKYTKRKMKRNKNCMNEIIEKVQNDCDKKKTTQ